MGRRILYGVQGEGFGHSSRSHVVIDHLLSQGHDVKVVGSHKSAKYLGQFFDVEEILGLRFDFSGSRVAILGTISKNIREFVSRHRSLWRLDRLIRDFKPDATICDFEPFTLHLSNLRGIKTIAVNHQHVLTDCRLDYPSSWIPHYALAWFITRSMTAFTRRRISTSFYFPPIKRRFQRRTSLVGPILRAPVLRQKPEPGEHLVLYTSAPEAGIFLDAAKSSGRPIIAYGFGRDEVDGLVTYKPPSVDGFLHDVATSRAVIAGAGYTLMSETLYFRKPMFSIPIQGQFEQQLNAHYLAKLGYGAYEIKPTPDGVHRFLDRLPQYEERLEEDRDKFNGNPQLFEQLDRELN